MEKEIEDDMMKKIVGELKKKYKVKVKKEVIKREFEL